MLLDSVAGHDLREAALAPDHGRVLGQRVVDRDPVDAAGLHVCPLRRDDVPSPRTTPRGSTRCCDRRGVAAAAWSHAPPRRRHVASGSRARCRYAAQSSAAGGSPSRARSAGATSPWRIVSVVVMRTDPEICVGVGCKRGSRRLERHFQLFRVPGELCGELRWVHSPSACVRRADGRGCARAAAAHERPSTHRTSSRSPATASVLPRLRARTSSRSCGPSLYCVCAM